MQIYPQKSLSHSKEQEFIENISKKSSKMNLQSFSSIEKFT